MQLRNYWQNCGSVPAERARARANPRRFANNKFRRKTTPRPRGTDRLKRNFSMLNSLPPSSTILFPWTASSHGAQVSNGRPCATLPCRLRIRNHAFLYVCGLLSRSLICIGVRRWYLPCYCVAGRRSAASAVRRFIRAEGSGSLGPTRR
jgi:hypothetical protein